MTPQPVRAAGCVVWRDGSSQPEVLLVHRPRYDDWSFPKGKLDSGESDRAAALREVEEETGLQVVLGPRLSDQHYTVTGGQPKVVAYWAAQPGSDCDITAFRPTEEIDQLRWVGVAQAAETLTYQRDLEQLKAFEDSCYQSSPLLVVRHAHARDRKSWKSDDFERPLAADGKQQAVGLVDLLTAYGVTRVVSSDAVRCVDSVLPFINASRALLRLDAGLSEEGASPDTIAKQVQEVLADHHRVALCSHRPVLPDIFKALGVEPTWLDPAGVVVIHRREGKVLSFERMPEPSTTRDM